MTDATPPPDDDLPDAMDPRFRAERMTWRDEDIVWIDEDGNPTDPPSPG